MSLVVTTLRRSLWLLLIGAVGGVAWSWWSDRKAPPSPSTPPEWPPIAPEVPQESEASQPSKAPESSPASSGVASIVNALVDAPEARSSAEAGNWVSPDADGNCPPSYPIKANDNSGIFHVPGGRSYDRTHPERCYPTASAAIADGYRQAKA